MWTNIKTDYKDIEGQHLTLERNEDGGLILEAKKGVFFETEEDFMAFLDALKAKAEMMFTEEL